MMEELKYCPSTLKEGYSTYSPEACRKLFGGKHVSHILDFDSPNNNSADSTDYVEHIGRISLAGFQPKGALVLRNGSLSIPKEGKQSQYILKPAPASHALLERKYCPANEHLTMQMAAQVDLIDAVCIGMELCGAYSLWRLEPGVMGDPFYREHSETQACTFDLPPVMKSNRAKAFVARQSALRGSVGANAALKWIIDNSASPMETAVYLLLCLPKRLGGYGLPKPILNPKLIISTPDGTKERYPDLYWIGASIDVEYNSDLSHSGEWARYRDSKREVELTVANVRVLPLTRRQLMSVSEFDAFAQGLRKMLGIRSRKVDSEWAYRRDELRGRLLAAWN